jgi:hypothetical protein
MEPARLEKPLKDRYEVDKNVYAAERAAASPRLICFL